MVIDPMAPIIIEKYGRAFRVHALDERDDLIKFQLILHGMKNGCCFWQKSGYATSAIPEVLQVIANTIKGKGYPVILRT